MLTIHQSHFTEGQWTAFKQAHRDAYARFNRFHFILDIRPINLAHFTHIRNFAQYLSGEMKEQSERQVIDIYIVNDHNGFVTNAIERIMGWYQNTVQVYFVDSVEAACHNKLRLEVACAT